jgi:hypothetical protein
MSQRLTGVKLGGNARAEGDAQMRVLVTAATRHDATHEIADAIAGSLAARGRP